MLGAGVDPEGLQFPIPEATSITVRNDGSLVALIRSTHETAPILNYPAPVAVQGTGSGQVTRTVGFGRPVVDHFRLRCAGSRPRYAVIDFDATELLFSTFGFHNSGNLRCRRQLLLATAIADAAGKDAPFPTIGGVGFGNYFEQPVACSGVAIYKFFAAGVLEFITYLAGETSENAGFVRLSPGGSLVVAGTTDSADFPVTAAALQPLFPALRTTP